MFKNNIHQFIYVLVNLVVYCQIGTKTFKCKTLGDFFGDLADFGLGPTISQHEIIYSIHSFDSPKNEHTAFRKNIMYSILTHYCRFLSKNSQVPKNYHFFLNSFVHSASYRLNVKILMIIFVGLDWVWTYASNVHSRIYQIQVGFYIYSFCYVIARTTKAASTKLIWVNSTSQI